MPPPPISDYTPYVQDLLQSDHGKAPDVLLCLLATDCIPMFSQLQANGFQGVFISSLYSDLLVKAMNGSAVNVGFNNLTENTPGIAQMKTDVEAFQTGASSKIDSGVVAGYASTDMFIQALKTAAKKGKSNITPVAVQKAAMHQTWQIPGLAGPTQYPQATAASYPSCGAELVSDGTQWKTVTPYACSKKQWKINPKFG
jgi:ABC-type branched-subunit amino acid transport system substrate-binding protein